MNGTGPAETIIPPTDWDDDPYYDAAFGVSKSARYHAKMRAYFQSVNDAVLVGNAILGTSAFVLLVKSSSPILATWLTAAVALMSAVATALGFVKRADLHSTLTRRFLELAAKVAEMDATDENLREVRRQRLLIEMDEPAPKRLIEIESRNDEARARGVPVSQMAPLSALQRRLGYMVTFGMARLERWKAEQQRTSLA